MNLSEIVRYKDRCFEGASLEPVRLSIAGDRWLGFELKPSDAPQIRLKDILSLRPMASFPDHPGWYLASPQGAGSNEGCLDIALEDGREPGSVVWSRRMPTQPGTLSPVLIDWPLAAIDHQAKLDLVLRAPASSDGTVVLLVSRLLKRAGFVSAIRGRGVEIGPGMTPQILPNEEIDVLYVDERAPSEWQDAYDYKKQKWEQGAAEVAWERYRAGGALELPVEAGSLDFIFGSHVFEHLPNPLLHLSKWLEKLRSGGAIHMILPNAPASVDFRQSPTRMTEILAEAQEGIVAPTLAHYERVFGAKAAAAMEERRSLHVHFYDAEVLSELLSYAVRRLGAGGHIVHHRQNYRELFFTLIKA